MRPFKVLKSFDSVYLSGVEGQVVTNIPLDDYTFSNWVENGLIEEVVVDETQSSIN
jgi:hypothetical protein